MMCSTIVGGDLQLDHRLVGPVPEPLLLGVGVGQVQLADELLELGEHDGVQLAVVVRDDSLLVLRVLLFTHVSLPDF